MRCTHNPAPNTKYRSTEQRRRILAEIHSLDGTFTAASLKESGSLEGNRRGDNFSHRRSLSGAGGDSLGSATRNEDRSSRKTASTTPRTVTSAAPSAGRGAASPPSRRRKKECSSPCFRKHNAAKSVSVVFQGVLSPLLRLKGDVGRRKTSVRKMKEVVRMKKIFATALLATLVLASVAAAEPVSVFVSILPQKYFVEQIGGERGGCLGNGGEGARPARFRAASRADGGAVEGEGVLRRRAPVRGGITSPSGEFESRAEDLPHRRGDRQDRGQPRPFITDIRKKSTTIMRTTMRAPTRTSWNGPREAIRMAGKILEGLDRDRP